VSISIRMPLWRLISRLGIPSMRRDFLLKVLPKGAVCAEIGVYAGDFSEHILKITQPKELHLIDPWKFFSDLDHMGAEFGKGTMIDQRKLDDLYAKVLRRFGSEMQRGRITVHRATSEDVASSFKDGYFDWVYIDGDHVYEAVKKDLEIFHKKVKPGGLIAGDDYCVSANYQKEGVKKAVDEFIAAGKGKDMRVKRKQYIFENV